MRRRSSTTAFYSGLGVIAACFVSISQADPPTQAQNLLQAFGNSCQLGQDQRIQQALASINRSMGFLQSELTRVQGNSACASAMRQAVGGMQTMGFGSGGGPPAGTSTSSGSGLDGIGGLENGATGGDSLLQTYLIQADQIHDLEGNIARLQQELRTATDGERERITSEITSQSATLLGLRNAQSVVQFRSRASFGQSLTQTTESLITAMTVCGNDFQAMSVLLRASSSFTTALSTAGWVGSGVAFGADLVSSLVSSIVAALQRIPVQDAIRGLDSGLLPTAVGCALQTVRDQYCNHAEERNRERLEAGRGGFVGIDDQRAYCDLSGVDVFRDLRDRAQRVASLTALLESPEDFREGGAFQRAMDLVSSLRNAENHVLYILGQIGSDLQRPGTVARTRGVLARMQGRIRERLGRMERLNRSIQEWQSRRCDGPQASCDVTDVGYTDEYVRRVQEILTASSNGSTAVQGFQDDFRYILESYRNHYTQLWNQELVAGARGADLERILARFEDLSQRQQGAFYASEVSSAGIGRARTVEQVQSARAQAMAAAGSMLSRQMDTMAHYLREPLKSALTDLEQRRTHRGASPDSDDDWNTQRTLCEMALMMSPEDLDEGGAGSSIRGLCASKVAIQGPPIRRFSDLMAESSPWRRACLIYRLRAVDERAGRARAAVAAGATRTPGGASVVRSPQGNSVEAD